MTPAGESPPRPDAVLARIVEGLDPAALAKRMAGAFRSEIAGYRRLPAAVVEQQIFEISRRNVELFFRSIIEGVQPTDEELAPFRESAEERATEGMALEDLLAAYRLGGRLGWQAIREAAGPGDEQALLLGAELTMRYVDRVSGAVAQTYLDERQHLVSEEERRLRELLDAVVSGDVLSLAMRELADRIGFVIGGSYRPFALRLPGARAREHSTVASALRGRGLLTLTEGDRVTGLAPESITAADFPDPRAILVLADPTPVAELAEAMDEARLLVDLGHRWGRRGAIEASDYLPELLLARSPRLASALRQRVLAPLEAYVDPRGADLVRTLTTFVRDGMDRRRSAADLHIHPNTLDYRIRRIQELAELNLSDPHDVTLITLALQGEPPVAQAEA